MSDKEMHHFIADQLPSVLLAIAEVRLPLQDIHTTNTMIYVMQKVYDERRRENWGREFRAKYGFGSKKETNPETTAMEKVPDNNDKEESLDYIRLILAQELVNSTAFQEGLLGPNYLGYLSDKTSSLANNERALLDSIRRVSEVLTEQPTLFGEHTKDIYEGFIKRLNKTRAMFRGVRVNPEDFPAFPTQPNRKNTTGS